MSLRHIPGHYDGTVIIRENGSISGTGSFKTSSYVYLGSWLNFMMHGEGTLTDMVKNLEYTGNFENDFKHGFGKENINNADKVDIYKGNFEKDHRNGQGIMHYSNRSVYDGTWNNGKRHGTGSYSYSDNTKYEGDWVNDKIEGHGVLYTESNKISYDGQWKDSKKSGKGVMYNSKGVYEGNFVENEKHGYGIINYPDGRKYEGNWDRDKVSGKGKMYYSNGSIYEGNWKLNWRDGQGILYFFNGNRYEGGYSENDRNGQGVLYYTDGSIFSGEYSKDERNGIGVMTLSDGTSWKGTYKDHQAHGEGIWRFKNGQTLKAKFFVIVMNYLEIYDLLLASCYKLAVAAKTFYLSGKDIYWLTTKKLQSFNLEKQEEEFLFKFQASIREEISGFLEYPISNLFDKYHYDFRRITDINTPTSHVKFSISNKHVQFNRDIIELRANKLLLLANI